MVTTRSSGGAPETGRGRSMDTHSHPTPSDHEGNNGHASGTFLPTQGTQPSNPTVVVQAPAPTPEARVRSLRDAGMMNFDGVRGPAQAEAWLQLVTKHFRLASLSEADRMAYVEYFMVGRAEHWWEVKRRARPENHPFSWAEFLHEFHLTTSSAPKCVEDRNLRTSTKDK